MRVLGWVLFFAGMFEQGWLIQYEGRWLGFLPKDPNDLCGPWFHAYFKQDQRRWDLLLSDEP